MHVMHVLHVVHVMHVTMHVVQVMQVMHVMHVMHHRHGQITWSEATGDARDCQGKEPWRGRAMEWARGKLHRPRGRGAGVGGCGAGAHEEEYGAAHHGRSRLVVAGGPWEEQACGCGASAQEDYGAPHHPLLHVLPPHHPAG